MKTKLIISGALLAAVAAGCATIPAEEQIDSSVFHASYETLSGVSAVWNQNDSLFVIDKEDNSSCFFLMFGAGEEEGEFLTQTPLKSTIKYAVHSGDFNTIRYNAADTSFIVDFPSKYVATATDALITANNPAIGVMSGTVEMKAVGGCIKVTLEENGTTFSQGGTDYPLTDIARLEITDSSDFMAGVVTVKMDADIPVYKDTLSGSRTISFEPMSVTDRSGKKYYVAGTYYLPVIPLEYKGLSYKVYDSEGRSAVPAISGTTLNVSRAGVANLGTVSWPMRKFSVNFVGMTADAAGLGKSQGFGSNSTGADLYNLDTKEKIEGVTKKRADLSLTNGGQTYICATTMQMGASTSSSLTTALLINTYSALWKYTGSSVPAGNYRVGGPSEYAWIKLPAQDAVLWKVDIRISSAAGEMFISDAVDSLTYAAAGNILGTITPGTSYKVYTVYPEGAQAGKDYYFCFGPGNTYKITTWTLYYKVY